MPSLFQRSTGLDQSEQDESVISINYLFSPYLPNIEKFLERHALMFRPYPIESEMKRKDVMNQSNSLQFSIWQNKITTKNNKLENFMRILELFKILHSNSSNIYPQITAPNEQVKKIWQEACAQLHYKPSCVRLAGAEPSKTLRTGPGR